MLLIYIIIQLTNCLLFELREQTEKRLHVLWSIIYSELLGYKTLFIGTTGVEIDWQHLEWVEKMTSYDPMDLQTILENAVQYWCTHAVIEVSSHCFEQSRFDYVPFHCAGLTNITAEHLDYHKNIDRYASSQNKNFSTNYKNLVINEPLYFHLIDDFWKRRSQRMRFWKTISFGFWNNAQLQASHIVEEHETHTNFILNFMGHKHQIKTPLVGKFNILNVLAAIWLGFMSRYSIRTTILEHITIVQTSCWKTTSRSLDWVWPIYRLCSYTQRTWSDAYVTSVNQKMMTCYLFFWRSWAKRSWKKTKYVTCGDKNCRYYYPHWWRCSKWRQTTNNPWYPSWYPETRMINLCYLTW